MKNSKPVKRLKLSRETLRSLADGELRKVAGREPTQNYTQCLTDTCSVIALRRVLVAPKIIANL
jgi:hypothetical protein